MKRIAVRSTALLAFLIIGFALSRSSRADSQTLLNSLASRIDRQASCLLRETVHYRHTPSYTAMVTEVATLRAKARHMRVTTFCSRSFHQLEDDLRRVHRCFHRIEDFFDQAEILADHGHGRILGNTRHVRNLLCEMEETIHQMQREVSCLRRDIFGSRTRGFIEPTTYHSYHFSSPSLSLGSSSIRYYHSRGSLVLPSPRDTCIEERIYRTPHYHRSANGLQIDRGSFSFRIRF